MKVAKFGDKIPKLATLVWCFWTVVQSVSLSTEISKTDKHDRWRAFLYFNFMLYIVIGIVIYCIGEAEINQLEREMF